LFSLQTEAKLHVQEMIRLGYLVLVRPEIMDIENSANLDFNRKMAISDQQRGILTDQRGTNFK
jgi:hypothetical protein